ncbi:hypothetical protein ACFLV0_05825 [Chloroflexota bacterium]
MVDELGKIEKPPVEVFKKGRKLYFIPLVYCGEGPPEDYLEIYNNYWEQVEKQLSDLELKLGKVNRTYHELISTAGEEGSNTIKDLNDRSYKIIQTCLDRGAQFEAVEDNDLLTEFMDWSRCLIIGLQNQKVISRVYESYSEVSDKRHKYISASIDGTLDTDETGILLMRENHQVQFPSDIQVFYIAPPALDEIKRWLRAHQTQPNAESWAASRHTFRDET